MRGCSASHIHNLIAEEGYLRPPDDEPQDFGYEKEMMQFVVRVQNERELERSTGIAETR